MDTAPNFGHHAAATENHTRSTIRRTRRSATNTQGRRLMRSITRSWPIGAAVAVLPVFCLTAGQPALAQQPITMKVGIVVQNDPLHESIKMFKDRLEARSNGRIKVELFPGAQLGGIPQHVQGVLLGTVEMFMTPPAFFVGAEKRFSV
ncbi:MAG: hypothetical protein FJX57_22330, partial [Alphaproteobacteria bacterium]|nr:hypothetical protein [Alphaproteobacteria bacterium]